MFVMTTMAAVASEIPCSDYSDRLSNDFALLLSAVAYKFTAAAGLPTLSYLTLLDKCEHTQTLTGASDVASSTRPDICGSQMSCCALPSSC
jgi:hypothetical protein